VIDRQIRVALDLTAVPENVAGAGVYMLNLARALSRHDGPADFVLFAPEHALTRLGIESPRVRQIPVRLPGRAARLVWEQTRLPRLLSDYEADILHSPHYTAPLMARQASVVTFPDMTFLLYPELHTPVKRVVFPFFMRQSAERASRLIAMSESTRRDMIRLLGVAPSKVTTIHLAASDDFLPRSPAEIGETCRRYSVSPHQYLLYVGVFEPRKNIPNLITAFNEIAAGYSDITLALAGKPGWMYEEIYARVRDLGLEGRVRFLGYVPDADLPALYSGARTFVYPSVYEGFGLPILEAMRCGTPVITSESSSMSEVAGSAAVLINPNDPAELRNAMVRVIDDPSFARRLRESGLARAAMFGWDRCATDTIAVYRSAQRVKWEADRGVA